MEISEIELLINKMEEFKYEDYIDIIESETISSEYKRGFDMGVGLCLTVLDELKDEIYKIKPHQI
jgi:hypothetical protein